MPVGLQSDIVLLMKQVRAILRNQIESDLEPEDVARIVSDVLYSSNYMCAPVIAGHSTFHGSYLCSMDGLGAQAESSKFVVVGSSSSALLSSCESMFVPNKDPNVVLETAESIMKKSLQRDVVSGCRIFSYTVCCRSGKIFCKEMILPDV